MNRFLNLAAALVLVLACAAGRAEATEYIYTTIDYPGATHTEANGINDLGQIVGTYFIEDDVCHSFILHEGVYTSFDPPSAIQSGSQASDINNLGQIVGHYDAGWRLRGFLRNGDDYTDIIYPGDPGTLVMGINDLGLAVGYLYPTDDTTHGFLFDGASYTTIDDTDAVSTYAWGINNAGEIVGTGVSSAGAPHPYVRDAGGIFTNFSVDGLGGGAAGINDVGQITGTYGLAPDRDRWGYVLTGGVNATPDRLVPPGAVVTDPHGINNLGQVVGWYLDAGGIYRGFLATPIATADFDRDGDVDSADLALWQGDYGLNANCDADADGDTDGRDFLVWQRQYTGELLPTINVSVPEPASLCLVLMALAGSVLAARNTF